MFIKNLFSMLLISLLAACSSTSTIVENQQPSSKVVSPEKKDDLWDITRENFEFTDSKLMTGTMADAMLLLQPKQLWII